MYIIYLRHAIQTLATNLYVNMAAYQKMALRLVSVPKACLFYTCEILFHFISSETVLDHPKIAENY